MNHYKRHLGDFAKDTSHLTALEIGVYNLLLDRYYATECPIHNADARKIARARTKEERNAVESVLREFFKLDGEVWRHGYADRVIKDYQHKAEVNREIGKRGGRPPSFASDVLRRTKPNGLNNGTRLETQTVSENNPSHKPVTISHKPEASSHKTAKDNTTEEEGAKPAARATRRCPTDFAVTGEMRGWASHECPTVDIDYETKKFRDCTFRTARNDWLATWRNWIRKAAEEKTGKSFPMTEREKVAKELYG